MLPRFAALEQRANGAVLAALSNALVAIGGAAAIPGIFDNEYVVADVGATGMAATAPAVTVPSTAVPASFGGAPVSITTAAGVAQWRIAEHHPDGSGLSLLLLERTA